MHGKPAVAASEAASEESAAAINSAAELGIETVGTLDLGGSSLEVTFMPSNDPAQQATSTLYASLTDADNEIF